MIVIKTPIDEESIRNLKIGDIIYLDGTLITCRDAAHKRFLIEKKSLPIDLRGLAIFHAGPIVSFIGNKWKIISIGPTTSMRMESYEYDFIKKTQIKMIIGKGGMGSETAKACKEFKVIHTIFPGGCAVIAAEKVENVEKVEWLDLGVPEALWIMKVKNLGPLIVSIDTNGNNLFEERRKEINLIKQEITKNLGTELSRIGIV